MCLKRNRSSRVSRERNSTSIPVSCETAGENEIDDDALALVEVADLRSVGLALGHACRIWGEARAESAKLEPTDAQTDAAKLEICAATNTWQLAEFARLERLLRKHRAELRELSGATGTTGAICFWCDSRVGFGKRGGRRRVSTRLS